MFRKLVVGTDGSARAERAVQEAVDLAQATGAELHLVAVFGEGERHWENIESSAKIDSKDLRQVAESVLARSAAKAREQGVEAEYTAREEASSSASSRSAWYASCSSRCSSTPSGARRR